MACIVYRTAENYLAVMYPNLDIGLTIEEIAEKDVPAGVTWEIAPDRPSRDHDWVGGEWVFVAPVVPVPEKVSRFQARAALYQAGLLAGVESFVASASPLIQIAWADAQEFQRTSPTINALATQLGWTEGQVDDLFRAAAQIVA